MTDAATEKFAALLRELKQRSGRSYGSLAARLHVSTSTLHRYCNGDAVPASYAPAEHLARLCGATPEELVELHRRWHRANGRRRGPAAGGGPTRPSWAAGAGGRPGDRGAGTAARGDGDVNDATADALSAGSGSAGRDGDARQRGAAAAAADDAGADAPAARGGSSADGAGAPAAASCAGSPAVGGRAASRAPGTAGTSGTAGSGGSVDKSASAAPGGPGRPAAGARGRRRRRVLLPAAGAAVATLVALVATSSGSTGEGRAAGGEGPESGVLGDGSRGGGGARGAETAEKGGSAGPPEPSEQRGPSPAGGGTGRGGGESGAAPRKGGAAAEEGSGPTVRTPLAWSVRSHVWEFGCDHRYVVDKPPADVPPPPMAQDAEAWAGSQGAVHGGKTNIEAVIEPRGDEQVTITAVHVRKAAASAPLPWNAFAMSDGCGGEVTEAAYDVDLDVPRPVLKPRNGADSTRTWEPPALPYRVTPDDPLSLLIHADTEDHDVRWYLEVEWGSKDDSGVIRIDDGGGPFRTSAIEDRPLYGYDSLNGYWRTWPLADDPDADDPARESASPAP